jgi:hypothetical protein
MKLANFCVKWPAAKSVSKVRFFREVFFGLACLASASLIDGRSVFAQTIDIDIDIGFPNPLLEESYDWTVSCAGYGGRFCSSYTCTGSGTYPPFSVAGGLSSCRRQMREDLPSNCSFSCSHETYPREF